MLKITSKGPANLHCFAVCHELASAASTENANSNRIGLGALSSFRMYTTTAMQTAAASQESVPTCACLPSSPFSLTVLANSRGVITLGVLALIKDLQQ